MQTTEQHAADIELAEGPQGPAQQGGAKAEALHSAGSEAFFTPATVTGGRSLPASAVGGDDVSGRPSAPPSGGRLDAGSLLNAITLLAGGAALAEEFIAHADEFGKPIELRHMPQTLSGDRGIRTEAVVMGIADNSQFSALEAFALHPAFVSSSFPA